MVTSVGHASGEGVISLGSQAWNIADGYTKIKILRLLIELDLYEAIAMFGYKELDDPAYNPYLIPEKRREGLDRMIFTLRQLVGNCKFAIEKKDHYLIALYLSRIEQVEKYKDACFNVRFNHVTKESSLNINEEHFQKSFKILTTIKDELNFPINRAGLIFRQSDEFDLDKIMNDIIEGG